MQISSIDHVHRSQIFVTIEMIIIVRRVEDFGRIFIILHFVRILKNRGWKFFYQINLLLFIRFYKNYLKKIFEFK